MLQISNAQRIVFPESGYTKGDVVRYYERIAERALPHLRDRPLSIRRYPKGLGGAGFFQKNVPPHYPPSIARFAIPRSRTATRAHPGKQQDVTVYPLLSEPEQLAYLANQGAIELHVPTVRASDITHPDRLVIDLDPPAGAFEQARRAAYVTRDALGALGLESVPIATGSKGYHVVAALQQTADLEALAVAVHQFATLLCASHPDELTLAFRVAHRQGRVFLDWLRLGASASVVAPYSLRATPRASVATPLAWDELASTAPDAFSMGDLERLLDRSDSLLTLAGAPSDPHPFIRTVAQRFEASGLVLESFDRFRS